MNPECYKILSKNFEPSLVARESYLAEEKGIVHET